MSYRLANRSDFATGLTVQSTLYDYWGHPVVHAQSKIASAAQEESLLARTLWVWEGPTAPSQPPQDHERPSSFRLTIELEIDSIRKLTTEDNRLPTNFLGIIWRHALAIETINRDCKCHPLALLNFASHPSNALRNAYAAAILANRICARLNMKEHEKISVTSAALTMNWSIFDLQDRLSSSRTSPNATDLKSITEHPRHNAEILRGLGLANDFWLLSVAQHHEEPDGKGYPAKLIQTETSFGAQILRACDRYIALTSSRRFRTGMLTQEAMKMANGIIPEESPIKAAFLADIGDHPPGGAWISSNSKKVHLSLGQDTAGKTALLSLSQADPVTATRMAPDFIEIPHPEFDNAQFRQGIDRLDAIATRGYLPPIFEKN